MLRETARRERTSVDLPAPGGGAALPADCLLRIPLVRTMLEDPCVEFRTRSLDQGWKYQRAVPAPLTGFNPSLGAIFVAARSRLSTWLADPKQSARPLNQGDELVLEVLFAVHDYLHVWAYRAIRDACPELRFGSAACSASELETRVFCHLVTEAAATVGLDYWYLSTVDLNAVVDVGTTRATLTTPYHERNAREYKRFCPSFDPQRASFLEDMVTTYCAGTFPGLSRSDVDRSPMILEWMKQELHYGAAQRSYARQWFAFVGRMDYMPSRAQLLAPCESQRPWQKRLVRDLSRRLWELVKDGKRVAFDARSRVDPREYGDLTGRRLDFRFVNACQVDFRDATTMARADRGPESMTALLRQLLSMHEHSNSVDARVVERALSTRDPSVLRAVLAGSRLRRVPGTDEGPALLFMLS
jgi:hypothetical protein